MTEVKTGESRQHVVDSMKGKKSLSAVYCLLSTVVYFLLFTFCCLLPAFPAFPEEKPCLSCHSRFSKPAKHVHEALNMGCDSCHQSVGKLKHPDEKGSIRLGKDMPALCYGCHNEAKFKRNIIHQPAKAGMCTACHDPHQSESKSLLVESIPKLCYRCHEAKTSRKNIHKPAAEGKCMACHNPHASDNAFLTPKYSKGFELTHINDLCVSCHHKQATGVHMLSGLSGAHPMWKKPDPSKPGREMSCASCHDPHSSDFPVLFVEKGLCGRCHIY